MKHWRVALVVAAMSASLVLAEDFKTINGKLYKDATISRVERDGIVLRTKTGISKVYFIELPKDVQERFHPRPSPTKTVAAQKEGERFGQIFRRRECSFRSAEHRTHRWEVNQA